MLPPMKRAQRRFESVTSRGTLRGKAARPLAAIVAGSLLLHAAVLTSLPAARLPIPSFPAPPESRTVVAMEWLEPSSAAPEARRGGFRPSAPVADPTAHATPVRGTVERAHEDVHEAGRGRSSTDAMTPTSAPSETAVAARKQAHPSRALREVQGRVSRAKRMDPYGLQPKGEPPVQLPGETSGHPDLGPMSVPSSVASTPPPSRRLPNVQAALSPSAVASAWIFRSTPAASSAVHRDTPSNPGDTSSSSQGRDEPGDVPDPAQVRQRELDAYLRAAIAGPAAGRGPPELRRDADGTCHFEGTTLNATIRPDGGVELRPAGERAAFGAEEPGPRPATPEEAEAPDHLIVRGSLSGAGWEAERDWFLRETRALRETLSDRARDRELARARVRLERRFERLWCDTTQDAKSRRRAIFRLWDQTSADEIGAQARAAAIDFIRRNLPPGSGDAYSAIELSELNGARSQAEAFAPYRLDTEPRRDAGVSD